MKPSPDHPCIGQQPAAGRLRARPPNSSTSSPAAPAASITRSAWRCRQIYGKAHARTPRRRCRPPRLGREPQSAAGRARRNRVHPRRLAVRRLEGQRGGRLQGAAQQAARHRRDLSELHPDRRQRRSGIKTLADLKGKRLSVGAPKSGTELNARAILKAAGMTYKDFAKVEYLPFAESVELMKNRQLDATLQSAGLGVASMRDLATSVEDRRRPDSRRRRDQDRRPGLPCRRPSPPTPTRARPPTCRPSAVQNYLVTHEGVPNETVYQMTKAMFDEPRQRWSPPMPPPRRSSPRTRAQRHAGAAASRRREVLPRRRPAQVSAARPVARGEPRRRRRRQAARRRAGDSDSTSSRPMQRRGGLRSTAAAPLAGLRRCWSPGSRSPSRPSSWSSRPSHPLSSLVDPRAACRLPARCSRSCSIPACQRTAADIASPWSTGCSAAVGFVLALYHWIFEADLIQRSGDPTTADLVVGTLLVVLRLRGRAAPDGPGAADRLRPVPALRLVRPVPARRRHPSRLRFRPDRQPAVLGTEGIFGIPTLVSATYIFLFILFGSFLEHAGMIDLFNDVALGFVGHTPAARPRSR